MGGFVVSKVSKSKYKGYLSSGSKKQQQPSGLSEEILRELRLMRIRLDSLENDRSRGASGRGSSSSIGTSLRTPSLPIFTPSSTGFSRQVRPAPTPSSGGVRMYSMISPTLLHPIAYGRSTGISNEGEIVNGVACGQNQSKVVVTTILSGCDNAPLHKIIGSVSTIGAAVGFGVIWPTYLLFPLDE